jgi:thiosulfate dehydrogenase
MALALRLTGPGVLAAAALAMACAVADAARAAEAPGSGVAAQVGSLQQAVNEGEDLFTHAHFGGSGTCETCHSNGGRTAGKLPNGLPIPSLAGAAADFPRYAARSQAVITLSQQMARCIAGALQGKPPAFGSPDMVYLETYVASLSKGAVMGKQFN